ncbi:MAG: DMT family transporter [Pseudomonadota bacterium]
MSARESPDKRLPASGYLLLAAMTLFWGTNWPVMKVALGELPVWSFRSLCLIGGALGLLAIARLTGQRLRITRREIGPLVLTACFSIVGWHVLSAYGVSQIPASRAVIIAFTMPLWAGLLAWPILGERPGFSQVAGLALGLLGLAALIGPDWAELAAFPLGAALMLGAALCWATGTVLLKRFSWTIRSAPLAGWQLLVGAVPVTLGTLLFEDGPLPTEISLTAVLAVAYIIAVPIWFCHWAYFEVVRLFPAGLAAIGTLAIPIVGVISSAIALGERVGWREMTAIALVCSALAVALVVPGLTARRSVPPSCS